MISSKEINTLTISLKDIKILILGSRKINLSIHWLLVQKLQDCQFIGNKPVNYLKIYLKTNLLIIQILVLKK